MGGQEVKTLTRKPALRWPQRPSVTTHAILGKRQRWWSACRLYRIERWPDWAGIDPFIVIAGETKIGTARGLGAACKIAQRHFRES